MSYTFSHSRAGEPGPSVLIPAIGLEMRVLLSPAASGGELAVIEAIHAPDSGPPLHRHAETEVFRVLRGRFLFEVDGKRVHAGEGDVLSVPGGAAHAFVNVSGETGSLLVLILPAFDPLAFFTELKAVMGDGRPDPAALAALGARWGMEFLGPPLRPDPQ